MIKALLLICAPVYTWDRIARARRGIFFVLLFFLIPTIVLSVAGEIAGRNYFLQGDVMLQNKIISKQRILPYGVSELGAGLLAVFVAAQLLKTLSVTFHNRNTYSQCFVVMAYTVGPFYLLHLLDVIPELNPWISFAAGSLFSFGTLYNAVPKVLKPDPPHAFGLFLMGGFTLTMLHALCRLFTLQVLDGRIKLF